MKNDPWLEKWMDLLCEKSADGLLLELGCGSGWDTAELVSAGVNVIAADIARHKLPECAQAAPGAGILQLNLAHPLPFSDHSMAVILASLSLHYFSWEKTMQLEAELRRCVQSGGILLARFNSTHDYHHGASSEAEIEPGFYQVGKRTKRFFDEHSVKKLLHGWKIQFLEENVIQRYRKPKHVWEAMAVSN
jgi:SAM-dependent methyltransferase